MGGGSGDLFKLNLATSRIVRIVMRCKMSLLMLCLYEGMAKFYKMRDILEFVITVDC